MLALSPVRRPVSRAVALGMDLLLPPRCLCCGAGIERSGALCGSCWAEITFLSAPHCEICALPFPYELAGEAVCAACQARPPAYDRARYVMRYDDASRRLILAFKHGDRTDAVPAFARWLARAGGDLVATADLVVPVPLHRWRLFRRRYNQAALLARALARSHGPRYLPDLLHRRRATPPQGRKSAEARRRNVAGAFALKPARLEALADRAVLLIDDVVTTGATVEACAQVLRRGGAARIDVLALARVIRTDP